MANSADFDLNAAIVTCIQEMAYTTAENGIDSVSSLISIEDYKSRFRKVSEKTSPSPSGRNLAEHYRASLASDSICFVYSSLMT